MMSLKKISFKFECFYFLQEAPCHICADRDISSPRNIGQINDLLHEGRHLDLILNNSSETSFFLISHSLCSGFWQAVGFKGSLFFIDTAESLQIKSQFQAIIAIVSTMALNFTYFPSLLCKITVRKVF